MVKKSACQPTSVFLPRKSHGQKSLASYSAWGHKRVGYNLATKQQQWAKMYTYHPAQTNPWYQTHKAYFDFIFPMFQRYPKHICAHTIHTIPSLYFQEQCLSPFRIISSPVWHTQTTFLRATSQSLPSLPLSALRRCIGPTGSSPPRTRAMTIEARSHIRPSVYLLDHLSWLRDLIWTADSGAELNQTNLSPLPYITKVYMILPSRWRVREMSRKMLTWM